jgi:hypothetical protein
VKPLVEDEVRKSFVNCSKGEAKGLRLPARVEEIPWSELEFLGWRDPKAVNRAYLVLWHSDEVIGLSLRAADQPKSRVKSGMCGFCGTVHGLADLTLFSSRRAGQAGKDGNTLGTYACASLACCSYLRGTLKPDMIQAVESLALEERIARMETKLHRFVEQVLETR